MTWDRSSPARKAVKTAYRSAFLGIKICDGLFLFGQRLLAWPRTGDLPLLDADGGEDVRGSWQLVWHGRHPASPAAGQRQSWRHQRQGAEK
jgi:hypothetical protein